MHSLEEFLTAKRAIVRSRQPGWIKAMNVLAVHEKRKKLLAHDDQRIRASKTAASHRRKIEKRIRDLQTLTIETCPLRGDLGELIITVKTDDFPHPIPLRRFFTNPLYSPAFQITKHHLFRLLRFIESITNVGAGIDEKGNMPDTFDFYGWDGEGAVIRLRKKKESRRSDKKGHYYLISNSENGRFQVKEVSSRVIRKAVQENPDPAYVVQRAEAWISGSRFHKPSSVGRAGAQQTIGEGFDCPADSGSRID